MYVHLAAPLFALYMLLAGQGAVLLAAMASIVLHEAGHGVMAALCGFPPDEVELTPLGCLLRLDDEAAMPRLKRLLMLLAGPLITLLLAHLALRFTAAGRLDVDLGSRLFCCNLAILCINLLPALPLDGGRLLALLLGLRLRQTTVRRVMRALGTVLGAALIVCNLAVSLRYGGWNLSLACAGCFLLYAAQQGTMTAAMQQLQQLMDRKARLELQGHLPAAGVAVMADMPLSQAVARLHPTRYTCLLLVERATMRLLGAVGEDQLVAACLDTPAAPCSILLDNLRLKTG